MVSCIFTTHKRLHFATDSLPQELARRFGMMRKHKCGRLLSWENSVHFQHPRHQKLHNQNNTQDISNCTTNITLTTSKTSATAQSICSRPHNATSKKSRLRLLWFQHKSAISKPLTAPCAIFLLLFANCTWNLFLPLASTPINVLPWFQRHLLWQW